MEIKVVPIRYTTRILAPPQPDTSKMGRQKRALYAEAYGMGDVGVGLITGQYPNSSYVKPLMDALNKRIEEDILRAIVGDVGRE